MTTALAVNAGSGSIRTALFVLAAEPRELGRTSSPVSTPDAALTAALRDAGRWEAQQRFGVIAHRVVHGGPQYFAPTRLTPAVLADLRRLIPFAPNHLPWALALIDAFARRFPSVPAIACFDTGFHATMPAVAKRLPIPSEYDLTGVRRYGFHGLSCASVIDALRRGRDPERAEARLVIAHLGNGSSLTATHHGRSVDTTMGFTPLGGVMMSTRSGDLDPGVVAHLIRTHHLGADHLEEILSHRSGLLGVSGLTGDMRTLLARTDRDSQLAVDMFVYQIAKAIGALAAALEGIDGLVFTGGIGEHAADIRKRIEARLAWLRIPWIGVVPADEERMMVLAAGPLLKETS
jgi:acetate kinase